VFVLCVAGLLGAALCGCADAVGPRDATVAAAARVVGVTVDEGPCGQPGKPCCAADPQCRGAGIGCILYGAHSPDRVFVCGACGARDQPACGVSTTGVGGPGCADGLVRHDTGPTQPDYCRAERGPWPDAGLHSQCFGSGPYLLDCGDFLDCFENHNYYAVCTPCGLPGYPCCPHGPTCQVGLVCTDHVIDPMYAPGIMVHICEAPGS
jgi:hypothetical protein